MANHKIKLRVGKWVFSPSWLMIGLTMMLLALFITLGCWQLHRYDEKNELLQHYQARSNQQPLSLTVIDKNPLADFQYYILKISGHFDNDHTFLLDNRMHNHQPGYHVLTPFITNSQDIILVNRGWVPRNADRHILPIIPGAMAREIQGALYIPLKKSFVLSNLSENTNWPRVIQAIDFSQMEQELKWPVRHFIIQLAENAPDGFVREWQPQVTPQKNLSYGLQWFTFAAVLLILFITLNTRRYHHGN